jgi:hypothetical protein
MKNGYLSQYFIEIGAKRLSAVEIDGKKSNQHELNGSKPLKKLFGSASGSEKFTTEAAFMWYGEDGPVSTKALITWYDARFNHETRSEYRLYFQTNEVISKGNPGDLLIIAKKIDGKYLMLIIPEGSSLEGQLLWLFGIEDLGEKFQLGGISDSHNLKIDLIVRNILEEIGITVTEQGATILDKIILPYISKGFPSTAEFSKLAQETAHISPIEEPDKTLVTLMDHEERLFRRLEKHLISSRLQQGFTEADETDVDGFISFSLSVQNRRKARAGFALENHLEHIFVANSIQYSRTPITENKSKPDFIFPSILSYKNTSFPANRLSMLGVKSTCKDRWRQVLTEADRVTPKHLLTLDPAISTAQTTEMSLNNLQLVVPRDIITTYKEEQKKILIDLREFIELVREKQR